MAGSAPDKIPVAASGIPSGKAELSPSARGKRRMESAFQSMSVLQSIRKHFIKTQPFAKLNVAACFELSPESANLLVTLRDGGAQLAFCPAQLLAPEDEIAASLLKDYGIAIFNPDPDAPASQAHLEAALATPPHLVLDEQARFSQALHNAPPDLSREMLGAVEQTESGVNALRRLAREGTLRYPVVALPESQTKQLFEHRYGTGQSVIEAIVRSGNILLAGLNVVVLGYSARGAGIALRAKGLGANIIVTEVDPVHALHALLDGHRVISIAEAASLGDVFVATTGGKNVIAREHFEKFKNGAILCNAGSSPVEFDLETLAHIASSHRPTRDFVEEFSLRDGRRIFLMAGGQSVTAAGAAPAPSSVLDLACASQALSAEYLLKSVPSLDKTKGASSLDKIVYPVPAAIDRQVAKMKLESMGVNIDRLTVEQEHFLSSSSDGA
jgi:adenosylhomocysteinase